MDSRDWTSREFVFDDSEAGIDAAMGALKKLHVFNKAMKKGSAHATTIEAPVIEVPVVVESIA